MKIPIHVSNSHTKFGWISSNGLGGDSVTDGWRDGQTDGGDCNIPDAFLKKRGDKKKQFQLCTLGNFTFFSCHPLTFFKITSQKII